MLSQAALHWAQEITRARVLGESTKETRPLRSIFLDPSDPIQRGPPWTRAQIFQMSSIRCPRCSLDERRLAGIGSFHQPLMRLLSRWAPTHGKRGIA